MTQLDEFKAHAKKLGLHVHEMEGFASASLLRIDDPTKYRLFFQFGLYGTSNQAVRLAWYVGSRFYNQRFDYDHYLKLTRMDVGGMARLIEEANADFDELNAQLKAIPVTLKDDIKHIVLTPRP